MFDVITHPNPILRSKCSQVECFGAALTSIVDRMSEAMYAARGMGLAAPQVGVTDRLVLVDPSAGDAANELGVLVNPRVTWRSQEVEPAEEGCLSLPGVSLVVPRSLAINIVYHDLEGTLRMASYSGIRARITQHEIDHLDGITLLDHVGPMARKLALKNLLRNG